MIIKKLGSRIIFQSQGPVALLRLDNHVTLTTEDLYLYYISYFLNEVFTENICSCFTPFEP